MITCIHGKDKYELSQARNQEGSGGSRNAPFLGTPFSKKILIPFFKMLTPYHEPPSQKREPPII